MKKMLILIGVGCLLFAGCGSSTKNPLSNSSIAVDNATEATTAAQESIIGSDVGTAAGGGMGAPAYQGAPGVESSASYVLPRTDYNATPDADGFYTVTAADYKILFPRFWWASSFSMKTKVTDKNGADALGYFIANSTKSWAWIANNLGPLNLETKIDASCAKRTLTSDFKKKITYDTSVSTNLAVESAGDMTLNVSITKPKINWTGTFAVTNTDKYTIPYWVHGETIDYTGSLGHTAHFDLVRDNNPLSATYCCHSGDGTVFYKGTLVAKVHLNGDGTGYYTLASENYATQHAFTEKAAE